MAPSAGESLHRWHSLMLRAKNTNMCANANANTGLPIANCKLQVKLAKPFVFRIWHLAKMDCHWIARIASSLATACLKRCQMKRRKRGSSVSPTFHDVIFFFHAPWGINEDESVGDNNRSRIPISAKHASQSGREIILQTRLAQCPSTFHLPPSTTATA